jgi:hypothetical protein
MSGLAAIIVLGTLILAFGIRLVLQASRAGQSQSVTLEEFATTREALDAVFVETAAIERIFSAEDIEFISRSSTPEVRRLFLKERKALAIQWLRKTQRQVARFMELHLRLAGYTDEPSPKFELELTAKYTMFFVVSYLLLLLLWFRGPFKARRMVGYTCGVAGYFCAICSVRLAHVTEPRS